MYKIYIVEDDKGIADGIKSCLSAWEMEVREVSAFRNVLGEIKEFEPHLIIMDITLPYMGGYHWCQEIRKTSNVPIIFISSATDNMNIVMAMNMGADDYIPKPFSPREVIARINAVLRRYEKSAAASETPATKSAENVETTGPFTIDHKKYRVSADSKNLKLTPKEFELMQYLVSHENQVLSRDQLLQGVWGFDYSGQSRMVDIQIAHLREKIEPDPKRPKYLRTVRGFGYEFSTGDDDAE